MGASLALAGVGSAGATRRAPAEKIVPYVRQPENIVQGSPALLRHGGLARRRRRPGVLAESHMGRPTMVEGNPDHPDSLGAIDRFTQAAILGLYDPDRSQVVTRGGEISTWDGFLLAAVDALDAPARPSEGRRGSGS